MQSASLPPHSANPSTTIGAATPADTAALVELVNRAYRGESSRRGWTTEEHLLGGQRTDAAAIDTLLAAPGHVILVMRDAATLLGCVLLEMKGDSTCYLGMLTISPDLQGQGLGERLLRAGEGWAVTHLACTAMEMTVIEQRADLIPWYERRGYRSTGEHRPFPYGDELFGKPKRDDLRFVVLRKPLGPP